MFQLLQFHLEDLVVLVVQLLLVLLFVLEILVFQMDQLDQMDLFHLFHQGFQVTQVLLSVQAHHDYQACLLGQLVHKGRVVRFDELVE